MIPFLLAMDVDTLAPQAPVVAQSVTATEEQAQRSTTFPYASLKLGAGFPQNYNGDFDLGDTSVDTSLDLNGGFTGELALGYQFNQVRAEVAVGYGNYAVNGQTFDAGDFGRIESSGNGSVNLTTVMLNGYYDIPITGKDGVRSRWSPYIGAGIGYANINIPSCSGSGCFDGGSTGGFAYQGNVGVSYQVSDRSQAFVETGYLGATSGSVDNVSFDNFGSWRVFLGWRQGFGGSAKLQSIAVSEPAPAPQAEQPAPAPEVQPPIRGLW